MSRHAFTLLEVLAALVMLGLLAATVVPMQRRVHERQENLGDALQAQAALAAQRTDPEFRLLPPRVEPVPGHPEWSLHIAAVPPDRLLPERLDRRWYRLAIRSRSGDAVLAEQFAAVSVPAQPRVAP